VPDYSVLPVAALHEEFIIVTKKKKTFSKEDRDISWLPTVPWKMFNVSKTWCGPSLLLHTQENQRRENALGHAHQTIYTRLYIIWLYLLFRLIFRIHVERVSTLRRTTPALVTRICRILGYGLGLLSIKGEDKPGGWWLSCANFQLESPTSTSPAELLYVF
jgi:hypothetical protein